MHADHFNFRRPGAHHRTRPGVGPQFRAGDTVSWRNPATGAHHGGLLVEFVYLQLGVLLVRGDFGRPSLRTGGAAIQSSQVRMDQVTLEKRGEG